jgi:chemotaxis protein CheZ
MSDRDDLYSEFQALASHIEQVKAELAALRPQESILTATDELDAIVQTTETATNQIMDAVEAIQNAADQAGGETPALVGAWANAIYEACNFQDLTGQRIAKVVKLLKHIEVRIDALVALFGPEFRAALEAQDGGLRLHADELLNGPQTSDKAVSQNDIDALFG